MIEERPLRGAKDFLVVGGIVGAILFVLYLTYYFSDGQRLLRCEAEQAQQFSDSPQGQQIINEGGYLPVTMAIMECEQKLGIKA